MKSNSSYTIATDKGNWESSIPKNLPRFISQPSGWYQESELPFFTSTITASKQSSLESELERDFLFVKGFNVDDSQYSVICKVRPFGLSKENYLLSNEKKIIESMLRGLIQQLLVQHSSDKQAMRQVAQTAKLLKAEVQDLSSSIKQQGKNYDVAITKFVQAIVTNLSKKFSIRISQSAAFITALKTYNYPFEDLEETISEHIASEINLTLAAGQDEVILTETHLKPLNRSKLSVASSTSQEDTIQLGRYTNTFKLLTRYERAADLVTQRGEKIIGKNIGKMCQPPVSNASITDALNKHARKVFELFQRYPDHWPLIRSEFKSVANIMEKETERRKKVG